MSKKTPWSLWTHTQYSQRMAPHAPHLKQPSRYMLVTPARMGVVSRHSIQLMSWPYQCRDRRCRRHQKFSGPDAWHCSRSRLRACECALQHFDRALPFVERGNRIDIQVHAKPVTQLIGDELRINAGLARQRGMGPSHNLKGRPIQLKRFEARCNEPAPGVVPPEWCCSGCRRENPGVGSWEILLLAPFGDGLTCY